MTRFWGRGANSMATTTRNRRAGRDAALARNPPRPTCERCRFWRPRVGDAGRVEIVCWNEGSIRWLIQTGAAETCGEYEPLARTEAKESS